MAKKKKIEIPKADQEIIKSILRRNKGARKQQQAQSEIRRIVGDRVWSIFRKNKH